MPDQLTKHVQEMQAAGVPEADILAWVNQFDSVNTPVPSHAPDRAFDESRPETFDPNYMPINTAREMGGNLIRNAPTVAAGAASMATGGVGVLPMLAAAGAGGGTALLRGDSLGDAVVEGLKQGAMEVGGQAVGGLLKAGGRRLYSGLLKAKDATLERFPNVVEDLMSNRRVISQPSRRRVIGDMQRIGTQKGQLLAGADQRAMVPRSVLREGLDDSLNEAMRSSEAPVKDMNTLAKMERDLLPDEMGVSPSRVDKIKTKLGSEADRGFRQTKMGTRVNDLKMRAKMNVSGRAKNALETIEPKLKDVNAAYASDKGQSAALRDALKRSDKHSMVTMSDMIGATVGGTGGAIGGGGVGAAPGAALGVALTRALTNPRVGSGIAIGMNEASKVPSAQAMRLLDLLMSQGAQQK